ncbi:MAG TPA: hypothetical protein VG733_09105, partial [Chthoniobacteraceae bacterium]|nr:hypothetical protein [Chthoniobacteraceae bacterium]
MKRPGLRDLCFVILSSLIICASSFAQDTSGLIDPDAATPTPTPVNAAAKAPAQWIAQLADADSAKRGEASAALLILGAKARDAVQAALDSKNPAIQSGAQEAWKTLRW